ncbi:hypothetical protein HPP92_003369 [Vanilla planifolia]|uniref:Uncharacterized protein n=1 Tax=Vanilla planifolia TaxID=51239 RepID=A0A835S7B2_VANPL|nr:hypothetical protein HPP92_003369 [Vanilla planifolia]
MIRKQRISSSSSEQTQRQLAESSHPHVISSTKFQLSSYVVPPFTCELQKVVVDTGGTFFICGLHPLTRFATEPEAAMFAAGFDSASILQLPRLRQPSIAATVRRPPVCCFAHSSNGRPNGRKSKDLPERLLEEKRRAELAARISSGEFTVKQWGLALMLKNGFSKLGPAGNFLEELLNKFGPRIGDGEKAEIPQAKGSFRAVRGQAFFIPLYELYLAYGGIFRLNFGPKSFLVVSDAEIARHILRDNCKAYSKGILAEILDFVMGKGLIPADGEIWRTRRRAIVPAMHQKYVAAMINLFGQASAKLCKKLSAAASSGEDVEMESLFSRLTLDVIGKAVFNYDFDSLSVDNGIVEAVYIVLREAEKRSTSLVPTWKIPLWKDISPRQKKVTEALSLINNTLDDLIATCKRMVDKEEMHFDEEYMNEQDPSILHFLLASGDDVTSKQLRDDLMTLLIAGHETSAAVLTWTFYLLSKEPRVFAKLQEEVDSVLGDRIPNIADMKNLKYTTRVINESLRLYPQPPVLIRRAIEDDQIGQYLIKRGEDIFISVWNIHRSAEHWAMRKF